MSFSSLVPVQPKNYKTVLNIVGGKSYEEHFHLIRKMFGLEPFKPYFQFRLRQQDQTGFTSVCPLFYTRDIKTAYVAWLFPVDTNECENVKRPII